MKKAIEFLKRVEGYQLEPYVPPYGNSGVTIGIGVDLGHMNATKLSLPESIKNKLSIYHGLYRDETAEFLRSNYLNLTKEEVNLISIAAIEYHLGQLEKWYNKDSVIPFSLLTDNQKTVLLSVKYQYGNLRKRTPKFWGFATKDNWECVYYELMNFGDDYPTRRETEARLILNDIQTTST